MATKKVEATTEENETIFTKLSAEKIETIAKQIWLAGFGTYGRSFDEVQTRFEKMNANRQKLFDELVVRGEKLQADAESKFQEGKSDLESHIEKLKGHVTLPTGSDVADQFSDVNRKLDTLNKEVKK